MVGWLKKWGFVFFTGVFVSSRISFLNSMDSMHSMDSMDSMNEIHGFHGDSSDSVDSMESMESTHSMDIQVLVSISGSPPIWAS